MLTKSIKITIYTQFLNMIGVILHISLQRATKNKYYIKVKLFEKQKNCNTQHNHINNYHSINH